MHVYLATFGGQSVTQQNKNKLAEKYGFRSGDKLRNEFTRFKNGDNRINISTTNKRAANEHLQRFKNILPLLENENSLAYEQAKIDLESLEDIYNKHY